MPRRSLALVLAAALAATLTGCATTVSLTPAADANAAECADVTVRLPDTLDGQPRRWTDAQATGAWGEPTAIILSCGVEPPGPTTLPCQTVDGVDWIVDDTDAPNYRFTTFGRVPAVEVYLDYDVASGQGALSGLSAAVKTLPTDGSPCTERG
ncbi:DUF3515 domain-containing protein [Microbacterium fluvii]|uniref:DUF3515 domain-containing protein n=1 Tax=Microbacterium fluvii TaxID=415215 RepID=A0ABW2HFE5_9MICO|nr:DUF3515 domain-containing protein [Microbacterium fluvii]MCU4672122.1 DUF3515 domain-containing protein [Microbacterium fluvii]